MSLRRNQSCCNRHAREPLEVTKAEVLAIFFSLAGGPVRASPLADRREDPAGQGDDAAREVGVLRGPASGRRSHLTVQLASTMLEGGLQAVQADVPERRHKYWSPP